MSAAPRPIILIVMTDYFIPMTDYFIPMTDYFISMTDYSRLRVR